MRGSTFKQVHSTVLCIVLKSLHHPCSLVRHCTRLEIVSHTFTSAIIRLSLASKGLMVDARLLTKSFRLLKVCINQ